MTEEQLYSLHDANNNVTAVVNNAGAVVERFTYTPYGVSTVLDASFTAKTNNYSTIAWNYRYTTREGE
jgi:YD repeat-containing protein